MSHAAIAAVLAMSDVTSGERLTAFSVASFANREHRAWRSTRVAAARAGLSRSQYLAARDGLARRGLVVVDEPGGARAITSRWIVRDPASFNPEPRIAAQTRPAPPKAARPLIAAGPHHITSEPPEQFVLAADEDLTASGDAARSRDAGLGNPATNPATRRARGKGTPEPRNQKRPPQPPEGEQRRLDLDRRGLPHRQRPATCRRP